MPEATTPTCLGFSTILPAVLRMATIAFVLQANPNLVRRNILMLHRTRDFKLRKGGGHLPQRLFPLFPSPAWDIEALLCIFIYLIADCPQGNAELLGTVGPVAVDRGQCG